MHSPKLGRAPFTRLASRGASSRSHRENRWHRHLKTTPNVLSISYAGETRSCYIETASNSPPFFPHDG